MGTIKIGPEEEKLISEIDAFKGKYEKRLSDMEEGLRIAANQFPANVEGEVKFIEEKICKAKEIVGRLRCIIHNISVVTYDTRESFSITWGAFNEDSQQLCQHVYGSSIKEPLTEKQFVYAITSWECEVRKTVSLIKQQLGASLIYSGFFSEIEREVHKIVCEYVKTKTT